MLFVWYLRYLELGSTKPHQFVRVATPRSCMGCIKNKLPTSRDTDRSALSLHHASFGPRTTDGRMSGLQKPAPGPMTMIWEGGHFEWPWQPIGPDTNEKWKTCFFVKWHISLMNHWPRVSCRRYTSRQRGNSLPKYAEGSRVLSCLSIVSSIPHQSKANRCWDNGIRRFLRYTGLIDPDVLCQKNNFLPFLKGWYCAMPLSVGATSFDVLGGTRNYAGLVGRPRVYMFIHYWCQTCCLYKVSSVPVFTGPREY